jgi:O-antigen ligase
MIETPKISLHSAPSADDYVEAQRQRMRRFAMGGALLALVAAGAFAGVSLGNPILPLVVLIVVMLPVLMWRYPSFPMYMLLAAICLFETGPSKYSDEITGHVPFFWNFNTIVQVYTHSNFKAIPLNLLEVFILLAVAIALIRAVYSQTVEFRTGTLFWPIAIYMLFVAFGWMHGMTSGGDFKISLQEVRSQFYFLLAYLFAVNTIRDVRQIKTIQWIMVLSIALKGVLYTFRRYVTIAGQPLPDQGVGSHEEAFFFDCFAVFLVILIVCKIDKRMRTFMWILLPLVVTGNLACNRRAATAAMVVVIPMLLAAAYAAFPARRKWIAIFSVVGGILGLGYYQAFKNSDSLYAQPARAIKSQFAPDERDMLSNAYRDAENADLIGTVKVSPVIGYGYGKRMLHLVPIADISKEYDWWDIMTHNQILWVWMRVGTIGFVAFWCMVCSILFAGCRIVRSAASTPHAKAFAMFSLTATGMLMIFGLLDLQLSNFRDMMFVGSWAGVLAAIPGLKQMQEGDAGETVPASGDLQRIGQ